MGHDQAKTPNFRTIFGWNPVMACCPKFGQQWFWAQNSKEKNKNVILILSDFWLSYESLGVNIGVIV